MPTWCALHTWVPADSEGSMYRKALQVIQLKQLSFGSEPVDKRTQHIDVLFSLTLLWVSQSPEFGPELIVKSLVFSRSIMSDSATPWTAACQTCLSFTVSWNLLRLPCIELLMPSNHLILCHPLPFLPSAFPSIRVFSTHRVNYTNWDIYIMTSLSF